MKQAYIDYVKDQIGDAYKRVLWHMSFGDATEQAQWFTYAREMEDLLGAVEAMSQREFHLWWAAQQPVSVNQNIQLALL